MNAVERQALREKHRKIEPDIGQCDYCWPTDYPCDVIKVLDELERWVKE